MCKRNPKKLALNLPSSSPSSSKEMMPTTPIIMSNNASKQRSTKHAQDMQECTSNIYQQGPACILPNLYLGAYYNALNATQLTRHGITCVVNVASEVNAVSLPQHIEYHHIKWTHSQLDLATSEFERAIALIRTAHDSHHTVMIHCQQGIERSAALVVAFLVKSTRCTRKINARMHQEDALAGQNWSFDRAFNFVKEKAPKIRPNMELLYQLREYEQSIPMEQQHFYQASSARADTRHNIRNRTKRSESIACSKPSAKRDAAALTSCASLQSLNPTIYYRRPRSVSVRDTSSSANLSFATTAPTTPNTSSCTQMDNKQSLAIAALVIVLVAMHQREYRLLHQTINSCSPDNDNDVLSTAVISCDSDGSSNTSHNNNRHLSSQFLKPVFPIY